MCWQKRNDIVIRKFLKRALHMPEDTPIAAFRDGGPGVAFFNSNILLLKKGLIEGFSASADERVVRIALALSGSEIPTFKAVKEEQGKHHKERLYNNIDNRGLAEVAGRKNLICYTGAR